MRLGPFIGRLFVVIAILAALYGLGWSLTNIGTIIRVLGIACLAAYLVNPIVNRLQGRGMSRSMAIASVFLGIFSVLAVTIYLVLPVVQAQIAQIGGQLEGFGSSKDEHIARLQVILEEKLPGDMMKDFDLRASLEQKLEAVSKTAISVATALLLTVASNLIYVFLTPMIIFILLQDGPLFHHQLVMAIPNRYFEVIYRLIHRVDEQLGGYIRGVLVVTTCVGTVSTLGLWIVGLKYFFVVGPLMGLLNIIPIFGPMIGMGLAAVVMLFQTGDPGSIGGPVIVGITAQVLDNIAFTPVAVSKSVDLHPLLVLLMTLIGGELFGLVGLLLAVPVTATVKVVWQAIGEARQSRRFAVTSPLT